jgi:hypothetical protein
MENVHMALIMSIFVQISLAFKGLQYFITLNAYTQFTFANRIPLIVICINIKYMYVQLIIVPFAR